MSDFRVVNSREQILKMLNGNEPEGTNPWKEMEDYFSMLTIHFAGKTAINNLGRSMILRCFINKDTGEVKSFLAKVLDVPDLEKLV